MKLIITSLLLLISTSSAAALNTNQRELAKNLHLAVNQINSAGPKMLDDETRLDSAATMSNYIIYNNTLVNYTVEQLDTQLLDKTLTENVIDKLCANAGLTAFSDLGVVMVYRYIDKNNVFVTELSKDMASCKS
ncbi:hypothetical protein MHM98_01490 [Psychrobium sp. MM17-31]|uniref:hypothetical protein n=1 Tax=Psychrobium sp. MM17-31 TaxID=2917758 RepID=UPI001EF6D022|nr:hypothetical protein [Psychrobium sp. MM17-31]MCG7530036.1 hypothetical protein [Psychrobium sp. MM17-31]